ncbi:AraC family transcriptional regulator [Peribacillus sp. Bi96]|uniref:AraC family transcriptional regulator n=1 Tax=Peribacillus sp. Bi96 TaxID=2884273 RepID=UPI001E527609|nr:AraC family transcriptional regulator [Peribacillus sp. Bi96]
MQKKFDNNTLFPLSLVYQDTKSTESELPAHFHDRYEIIYVYDGEGIFFIDNVFHNIKKGDLIIIPGNTIHHTIHDKDNPVTCTVIFFNPLLIHNNSLGESFSYHQLFEKSQKAKYYKYSMQFNQQKVLESHFEDMNRESTDAEFGFKHAILLQLHMVLHYLNRMVFPYKCEFASPNWGPLWMKDILSYIENNFTNGLSLVELANKANVSTAHFSRVFKQMIGLNVSDYIVQKKIIMAKELLLHTDENISVIAERSGFQSMPHFHHTFKKHLGSTPGDYRKNRILILET